jgi:hypothetical protein
MAGKRYHPKTKAAILSTVKEKLESGKPWKDAFEAGKKAKYTGSEAALKKMYYANKPKTAKAKKPGRKARTAKVGRPAAHSDMSSIQATLNAIVQKRVRAAFDDAIAMLQAARDKAWDL